MLQQSEMTAADEAATKAALAELNRGIARSGGGLGGERKELKIEDLPFSILCGLLVCWDVVMLL